MNSSITQTDARGTDEPTARSGQTQPELRVGSSPGHTVGQLRVERSPGHHRGSAPNPATGAFFLCQ